MNHQRFDHVFVEYIPAELAEGTIYVSITYATAVHLCACGCGNKVVTPVSPAEWQLTFDGDTVSLNPSVGNWEFPCRSHYWIRRNRIQWAADWSDVMIEAGRRADARDLDAYLSGRVGGSVQTPPLAPKRPGLLGRLKALLRRKA